MINTTLDMEKRCPSCRIFVSESCSTCPNCGYDFNKVDGMIYSFEPSSATAYTSSFTALADEFNKSDAIKKKEELINKGISESTLESFVDWGYLLFKHDKYSLTGLGKEAYYKNKEIQKRKKKK